MKKYAVIGNPIAHSQSPQIHQEFASQFGLNIEYSRILAEHSNFNTIVQQFQQQGGLGMNVTMPFKQMALELCDQHSQYAEKAGAVNTLLFQADGSVFGDNTDGYGLVKDLHNNHKCAITNQDILIFGAGGAVRGILAELLAKQPKSITIANRTFNKAKELATRFNVEAYELHTIPNKKYELIINASGASADLAVPRFEFSDDALAYDLNYTQATPWPPGLRHTNGMGMLVEQAAQSFYLWHGLRPNTSKLIDA